MACFSYSSLVENIFLSSIFFKRFNSTSILGVCKLKKTISVALSYKTLDLPLLQEYHVLVLGQYQRSVKRFLYGYHVSHYFTTSFVFQDIGRVAAIT